MASCHSEKVNFKEKKEEEGEYSISLSAIFAS